MTEISKEAVARIAARRVDEARKRLSEMAVYSTSDKRAAETALEVAAEMLDLIIGNGDEHTPVIPHPELPVEF